MGGGQRLNDGPPCTTPSGFIDMNPEYFDHSGLRIATIPKDVDISIPHHKKIIPM
jgi:hypothetical protein